MNKPQSTIVQNNSVPAPASPKETVENIPAAQPPQVPGLHPSVTLVPSTPVGELKYKHCVPLPSSPKAGVKICIHPVNEDIYISRALQVKW